MKALLRKVILLILLSLMMIPLSSNASGETRKKVGTVQEYTEAFPKAAVFSGSFLSAEASRVNPGMYKEADYQKIKSRFLQAVTAYEDTVALEEFHLTSSQAFEIYYRLYNETPHFFYLSYSTSALISEHNEVLQLNLDYYYPKSMIPDMKRKLEEKITLFLSDLDETWTDFEKALYVYDKLILETSYTAGEKDSLYTVYGVFTENQAVCQGYASAYTLIMRDYLGIETHYIYSKEMNHAWNLIRLNGQYYHVDATWGDPQPDEPGRVNHRFFLLSDDAMRKTEPAHKNWNAPYLSTDTTYDESSYKAIQTGLIPTDQAWIGIDGDGALYFYNFKRGVFRYGNHLTRLWSPIKDETVYYTKNYSTLLKSQNTIYFHDHDSIYSMDPITNKTLKIFTKSPQDGFIYGMSAKGSDLTYYLKKELDQQEYLLKTLDLRPFSFTMGIEKQHSLRLQWMSRSLLIN
ncbi:transglutaminase domain-containing protein [Proteiniclasticum ruminis]|uniref:transglutaminase domain-containing protein n=1 Tax=Proteiniclasticum ruminis TaxID=398199 RepID=UPI00289CBD57|nr:transglutaminase domain-containing protein [Proteiniclasticum ruminis]